MRRAWDRQTDEEVRMIYILYMARSPFNLHPIASTHIILNQDSNMKVRIPSFRSPTWLCAALGIAKPIKAHTHVIKLRREMPTACQFFEHSNVQASNHSDV